MTPLTPYVSRLLHALPRRKFADGTPNPSLFSSASAADGRLTIPRNFHSAACKVAGIEGLTLHGLRRSFKALSEWPEIPAGVVAQLMGHKASATAEKHYTVRPLDLWTYTTSWDISCAPAVPYRACGGIVATAPRSGTTTTVRKAMAIATTGQYGRGSQTPVEMSATEAPYMVSTMADGRMRRTAKSHP